MSAVATLSAPAAGHFDLTDEGSVTVSEATTWSGLPRSNLYELMERGELAYTKVGRRRLIMRRSLRDLLRRGLVGGEMSKAS